MNSKSRIQRHRQPFMRAMIALIRPGGVDPVRALHRHPEHTEPGLLDRFEYWLDHTQVWKAALVVGPIAIIVVGLIAGTLGFIKG